MNLRNDGDFILNKIKRKPWFPYDTGNLKFNATSGELVKANVYRIKFDSKKAPYVEKLEDEETTDFGNPNKHLHFIKNKVVKEVIDYFVTKCKGELR